MRRKFSQHSCTHEPAQQKKDKCQRSQIGGALVTYSEGPTAVHLKPTSEPGLQKSTLVGDVV